MSPQLSLWQEEQQRQRCRAESRAARRRDSGTFGHSLPAKTDHVFQIVLLNIGGLQTSGTTVKNSELCQHLREKAVDVCCLTETNVHWKSLPLSDRQHSQFQWWFESIQVNTAYYMTYPWATPTQVGGTCLLSINEACHRLQDQGRDKTLGRWAWTRYRGKAGVSVKVYSAYRPVKSTQTISTVYQQQIYHYQNEGKVDICPRKQMIDDLCQEVTQAITAGDQVVVALDANEDLRSGYAQQHPSHAGLMEINFHHHGQEAPETYNHGRVPIDGEGCELSAVDCAVLAKQDKSC